MTKPNAEAGLVERLKRRAACTETSTDCELLDEAANEIERLTALLSQAREPNVATVCAFEAGQEAGRAEMREEAAKAVDAHAAKHARLQQEAAARRPGSTDRFPHGPGHMAMSHGGLSGIYADLAAEVRSLSATRKGGEG